MFKLSSLLLVLAIFLYTTSCNARSNDNISEIFLEDFYLDSIKNYTFGTRVDGDTMRESRSYHQSQSSFRYHFSVRRPWVGVISQVQLLVEQSQNEGRARIIFGGIGEKSIQIRIDVPGRQIRFQAIVYVKSPDNSFENEYLEDYNVYDI